MKLRSKWFLEMISRNHLESSSGVGWLLSGQIYQTDFQERKLWEIITSTHQTQCKTRNQLVHKQVQQVPQVMPAIISKLCVWLKPSEYYPPHADHRHVCFEGIFPYLPIFLICLLYVLCISSSLSSRVELKVGSTQSMSNCSIKSLLRIIIGQ